MPTPNPAQSKLAPIQKTALQQSNDLSTSSEAVADDTVRTGYSEVLVAAEAAKTVRAAVNKVVLLYSFARKGDVSAFVDNYTARKTATMVDLFGSADFRLDKIETLKSKLVKIRRRTPRPVSAVSVKKSLQPSTWLRLDRRKSDMDPEEGEGCWIPKYERREYKEISYSVGAGVEGFHSRAFSDEDNLYGLVTPEVTKVLGLKRTDEKMLAKLDIRKERRAAVRSYVAQLTQSRGQRG